MYDRLPARERGVRKAEEFLRRTIVIELTPEQFQSLGRLYAQEHFKKSAAQRQFILGWYA